MNEDIFQLLFEEQEPVPEKQSLRSQIEVTSRFSDRKRRKLDLMYAAEASSGDEMDYLGLPMNHSYIPDIESDDEYEEEISDDEDQAEVQPKIPRDKLTAKRKRNDEMKDFKNLLVYAEATTVPETKLVLPTKTISIQATNDEKKNSKNVLLEQLKKYDGSNNNDIEKYEKVFEKLELLLENLRDSNGKSSCETYGIECVGGFEMQGMIKKIKPSEISRFKKLRYQMMQDIKKTKDDF